MFDAIGQLFQGLIDFLQPILIPDWRALIDLLPILLLIGVVGPLLSLLGLGWFLYIVGRPRSRIPYQAPAPQPARIVDGQPVYPAGEPYCAFDQLVYPPGETRCADLRSRPCRRLPEVQHRPPGPHRHLRHLRPRPQDRSRRARPPASGPAARWRRGGLTDRNDPIGVRRPNDRVELRLEWSS